MYRLYYTTIVFSWYKNNFGNIILNYTVMTMTERLLKAYFNRSTVIYAILETVVTIVNFCKNEFNDSLQYCCL